MARLMNFARKDVKPPKLFPDGAERELVIVHAGYGPTQAGDKIGLNVMFRDVKEGSKGAPISWWIEDHTPERMEEDPDSYINASRRLQAFAVAFSLPDELDPDDIEDIIGQTGRAILTFEEDPTYGEQNKIRRFVVK